MVTSQILKSVGLTKTQKSWLFREQNISFSSNKKIHQLHIKPYFMTKNSFVEERTLNIASDIKYILTN